MLEGIFVALGVGVMVLLGPVAALAGMLLLLVDAWIAEPSSP